MESTGPITLDRWRPSLRVCKTRFPSVGTACYRGRHYCYARYNPQAGAQTGPMGNRFSLQPFSANIYSRQPYCRQKSPKNLSARTAGQVVDHRLSRPLYRRQKNAFSLRQARWQVGSQKTDNLNPRPFKPFSFFQKHRPIVEIAPLCAVLSSLISHQGIPAESPYGSYQVGKDG